MTEDNYHNNRDIEDKYMFFFFAGGETQDNKFNVFTGSFIRLIKEILIKDFWFVKGVYYKSPIMNVIWALNNAQEPIRNPENDKITSSAFNQILSAQLPSETQLVLVSSSSGSVVAAQSACFLAKKNIDDKLFIKPFHVVLGASMISPDSGLYRKLLYYQQTGIIGTIIHKEIQDEGDTSFGVGGLSRLEAYKNAFYLMLPIFSKKINGPSFLNTHPEKGHIHRRRSQSVQKAIDYINIILIKHKLAGEHYMERAKDVVNNEKNKR
jgi:hypothetical protein